MKPTLFKYQIEGIERISQILKTRKSALLADEMGLGKTAQALMIARGKTLVVCPASLKLNWFREKEVWNPGLDLSVVSYNLAHKVPDVNWDLVIYDEAHYLKSAKARRTKACFGEIWKRSTYHLLLTGTPMPNGVIDGFELFHKLDPDTFKDYYRYGYKYCNAKKNWFTGRVEFKGGKNLTELGAICRSRFMVRRRKAEVLKELPAKTFQTMAVEIKDSTDFQVDSETAALLNQTIEDGSHAMMSEHVATIKRGLGVAKVHHTFAIALDILTDKKRLVIFTWHRQVAETLGFLFEKHGTKCRTIQGGMSMEKRDAIIADFQSPDPKHFVLIAQIQAAGVGITLTAADTCLFAELDWSPATMAQAIDRLHRIGQQNNVQVIFLIGAKTLDEQIIGTLREKIKAISEVMG